MDAAIRHIKDAARIVIISHFDPDGDAIGTMLGLTWALRSMGKHVTPAGDDGAPWPLEFLPGASEVRTDLDGVEADLTIVVDCSDARRAGKAYEQAAANGTPLINIDHHKTNSRFGDVNVVQPEKVAAAEIAFDLLKTMQHPIDTKTATCLLTGLVTDTRGFKTPNVTRRVLAAAVELMDAGASLPDIMFHAIDRKSFRDLATLGQALSDVQFEDGVAWSSLSLEARRAAGSDQMSAAPRNFSSLLGNIEDASIGVFFTEKETGRVDISMRSKPGIDLTVLFDEDAALHGQGGGHPQASGAEVEGSLEAVIARIVPALQALAQ